MSDLPFFHQGKKVEPPSAGGLADRPREEYGELRKASLNLRKLVGKARGDVSYPLDRRRPENIADERHEPSSQEVAHARSLRISPSSCFRQEQGTAKRV